MFKTLLSSLNPAINIFLAVEKSSHIFLHSKNGFNSFKLRLLELTFSTLSLLQNSYVNMILSSTCNSVLPFLLFILAKTCFLPFDGMLHCGHLDMTVYCCI